MVATLRNVDDWDEPITCLPGSPHKTPQRAGRVHAGCPPGGPYFTYGTPYLVPCEI